MIVKETQKMNINRISLSQARPSMKERLRNTPWWLMAIITIAVLVFVLITTNSDFNAAFSFIKAGLVLLYPRPSLPF
jgi:hypothetical protein